MSLPNFVENGGPIVGSLGAVNALKKAYIDTQYAPYNDYADALSKIAYANMAGPTAMAQVLANPLVLQNIPRDQANALIGQFSRGLSPAMNATNLPPPPQANNSLLGMILNRAQSTSSNAPQNALLPQASGQAPLPAMALPTQSGNSVMPPVGGTTTTTGGSPSQNAGYPNQNPAPGYNTPASKIAGSITIPGSEGGLTPTTGADAQAAALKTAVIGQAANANEQWKDFQNNTRDKAENSVMSQNQLDQFHGNYKKSFFKGPGLSKVDPSAWYAPLLNIAGSNLDPEQETDRLGNQLQASVAGSIGHENNSRVGQMLLQLAGKLKLGRDLGPGAEENLYNSLSALNTRSKEQLNFNNELQENNPDVTPQEAQAIWNDYQNAFPAYDYKNDKPLPENLNKSSLFASKEALQAYRKNPTAPIDVSKQKNADNDPLGIR